MKLARIAALTLAALSASDLNAATFTVVSMADSGPGTLRDCIVQAQTSPGADIVQFHPSLSGTLRPLTTIFMTQSVTIIGPESRGVSIDASAVGILLHLSSDPDNELGLIDLEFFGGQSAVSLPQGGHLNVHRCVFRDFGSGMLLDAGVFNPTWNGAFPISGSVRSSSFINNRGVRAGVVITTTNASGEALEFVNCTFCDNSSTMGASIAFAWNLDSVGQGTLNFLNCTMTGNDGGTLSAPVGAINYTGNVLACRVKNCIMDENTGGLGSDPNFTGTASGRSLEGVNVFSNSMLSPLTLIDRTYIRIPLPGSPCINAAHPDPAVLTDQITTARPFLLPNVTPGPGSDGSDVGAVERQSGGCGFADINGSGRVDGADLSVILSTFGSTCP